MTKAIQILGTRGVPAGHGGFETFAEKLALYLVERGWEVTVYCQLTDSTSKSRRDTIVVDHWNGIRRISIATRTKGPLATIEFDWNSTWHCRNLEGVVLVLGYNTAIFSGVLTASNRSVVMNMDGIEWKRGKWGPLTRAWFFANEYIGARLSTKLIADCPAIAERLRRIRDAQDVITIAYGADPVTEAPLNYIEKYKLTPRSYLLAVARIEPENSTLEMVKAFSRRERQSELICVGHFNPETNAYHRAVAAAAGREVRFIGAVYDKETLKALRFHALTYCHGHTVGGTNPSLVEALAAGNPVIAHNNIFNSWVAGPHQQYFSSIKEFDDAVSKALSDREWLRRASEAARGRFEREFTWDAILSKYEELLASYSTHTIASGSNTTPVHR